MSEQGKELRCPHCNERLRAFRVPELSTYEEAVHWACFNDDCCYYRDGWKWMQERYAAQASYRYRVMDAAGTCASPLAVWSDDAVRDLIIEEQAGKQR